MSQQIRRRSAHRGLVAEVEANEVALALVRNRRPAQLHDGREAQLQRRARGLLRGVRQPLARDGNPVLRREAAWRRAPRAWFRTARARCDESGASGRLMLSVPAAEATPAPPLTPARARCEPRPRKVGDIEGGEEPMIGSERIPEPARGSLRRPRGRSPVGGHLLGRRLLGRWRRRPGHTGPAGGPLAHPRSQPTSPCAFAS